MVPMVQVFKLHTLTGLTRKATTTTTTKTTKSNSEPFYFRKLSVKNVNFTKAFLQGVDSFKK